MPRVPSGKRAVAMAMWPLSTSVKRSRISVGRRADGDGARDVGGAVEILRAAVDEEQLARAQLAVGRLGDAVVDDGAVGPAAGDGVEADLAAAGWWRARKPSSWRTAVDLVELARRASRVEPGEEADDRGAVAHVRRARALDLGRVLDRLQREAGIGPARDASRARRARARTTKPPCSGSRRTRFLALRRALRRSVERCGRAELGDCLEMRARGRVELLRRDEELGLARLRERSRTRARRDCAGCRRRGC